MNLFRNVGDILKSLKRRPPSQLLCPRCGSPKIQSVAGFYKALAPRKYSCSQCGYSGPIVMELEKEKD